MIPEKRPPEVMVPHHKKIPTKNIHMLWFIYIYNYILYIYIHENEWYRMGPQL
jgi:hypothetical protein